MYSEIVAHCITAVTLGIGVAFYVHRHKAKLQADRLERTLDFIRTVYEREGPIHQANMQLAHWLGDGSKKLGDASELSEDKLSVLIRLLDFFDLMSQAAIQNSLDAEMVVVILGGKMRSVLRESSGYIQSVRDKYPDRSEIYLPYEKFVADFVGDRPV